MTVGADAVLDRLAPVDLSELLDLPALQTRVDRKYIASAEALAALLDGLGREARVLEDGGRRSFAYESVYFDTPELDSYLSAARGRPRRFKVRTRSYLDSGLCWVEVKLRNARGQTVKQRLAYDVSRRNELDSEAADFVHHVLGPARCLSKLAPSVTTSYVRSTLVVPGSRATIDQGFCCRGPDGRVATFGDARIVETKSDAAPGPVDRALWRMHIRPVRLSKYGIGMAALDPALPSNRWHRALLHHVATTP